jgi:alkylation response protein AidB-like acyl-CoA dehydrogenase
LYDLTGEHHFNEVFFEDVRVPVENRVGEENAGWYVLAEHLDFERSGIERLVDFQDIFDLMLQPAKRAAKERPLPPALRSEIVQRAIELQVGRLMCYRVAWMQQNGLGPNAEASMAKVFGTEWSQRMANTAMKLAGLQGASFAPNSEEQAYQLAYLNAVSRTIAGGTSEIQRNIIATRGLGLAR